MRKVRKERPAIMFQVRVYPKSASSEARTKDSTARSSPSEVQALPPCCSFNFQVDIKCLHCSSSASQATCLESAMHCFTLRSGFHKVFHHDFHACRTPSTLFSRGRYLMARTLGRPRSNLVPAVSPSAHEEHLLRSLTREDVAFTCPSGQLVLSEFLQIPLSILQVFRIAEHVDVG